MLTDIFVGTDTKGVEELTQTFPAIEFLAI